MIDPILNYYNGFNKPVVFSYNSPLYVIPIEKVLMPGDSIAVYDQRSVITAMTRDLNAQELEELNKKLREDQERENGNDK